MEITTKGRYAVRTMVDIAKNNGDFVSIAEISKRQDISEKYLEKIISMLVKAGLLDSMRGKTGGYKLNRAPKNYSLHEILNATGDQTEIVYCLHSDVCPRADKCDTQGVWGALDNLINDFLKKTTLQDLLDKNYKYKK